MATSTYYGVGIDGNKYGFKADDEAYPASLRAPLKLTRVAPGGTIPSDVRLQPDNQVVGVFPRFRAGTANGKSYQRFSAANAGDTINQIIGTSLRGSKVERVAFVG